MTTSPSQSEPLIEVTNLTTHYGSRQILNGISLTVNKGEVMVIMGGSGSGKSTLLRHLIGLERPTGGCIKLLGQDIGNMTEHEMTQLYRKVGVAFQGGALFSSMTVGENIMLPLREHTKLDQKTMEIMVRLKLEVVNLAGFEYLMPSELSGGMLKRAAFAHYGSSLAVLRRTFSGVGPRGVFIIRRADSPPQRCPRHDHRRRFARTGKRFPDCRSNHRFGQR